MYLVQDIVKFRENKTEYVVVDVDDQPSSVHNGLRYKVMNKATKRVYSFWVYPEDLEYIRS